MKMYRKLSGKLSKLYAGQASKIYEKVAFHIFPTSLWPDVYIYIYVYVERDKVVRRKAPPLAS